jgi:hypothetical protein
MHQGIFTEAFPGAPAVNIYDPATTHKDPVTGQNVRDPFPNFTIPANRIDPIGLKLLNLLPLPTFADRLAGNYLANPVKTLDDYQGDIRIDHNISNHDRLFGRFSFENAKQYLPTGLPDYGATGGFSSNQTFKTNARNIAVSQTHIFKNNLINQFTAGYNRVFNYITSFGYLSNKSTELGIPGANLGTDETSSLTRMTFQNFVGIGDRGFSPFQGGTNVFHYADTITKVKGSHTLNGGLSTRFMQLNLLGDTALAGQFAFTRLFTAGFTSTGSLNANTGNSIASLLLGLPSSGGRNDQLNGSTKGRRWKEYRGFIDDTWRVSNSLTMNLGESKDRFSNFDFYTGKTYVGGTIGVKTDFSNIQPRIGFAWSPRESTSTVIRGGYGIYHDVSAIGGSTGPYQNPPFANAYAFTSDNITPVRTLSTGFPDNTQAVDPAAYTGVWTTIDPNSKQGRVQQWSFNVERKLPSSTVLSVAYAGSYADRLFDKSRDLNTAPPGPGFNAAARRPYPQLQSVIAALSRGWMQYNSMQVRVERRASKGFFLLASYTYAQALTNGVSGFGGDPGIVYFPVVTTKNADKGSSNTDLRHNFSLSTLYIVPVGKGERYLGELKGVPQAILGGWQINAIFVANSGYPLGMSMSSNLSGTGFGNRPDRVCDGKLDAPTIVEWFDTSCFVAPAAGVLGNAARTTLVGPGRWNADLSVSKKFQQRLQFRAEIFNLFNHAQFQTPGTTVGSPTFGVIQSTVKSSRQVQFALKYVF